MFDINKVLYSRFSWLGLIVTALVLIGIAIYFQEVMSLEPCFLCINQRLALLIISFGGLLGLLNPKNNKLMICGFGFWLIGSLYGIGAAGYQVYLQHNPVDSFSCAPDIDYLVEVKGYFEAFAILLDAPGSCSDIQWIFLGLSMPEWMVIIFLGYVISLVFFFLKFLKK